MERTVKTCEWCEYGKYNPLTNNYNICTYPYNDDPLMDICLNTEKMRQSYLKEKK